MFAVAARFTYLYGQLGKAVSLTDAAIKSIKSKRTAHVKQGPLYFLRLDIEAGEGCEGYRYKFKYDDRLNNNDCILEEPSGSKSEVLFATDEENLRLLQGSLIDYEEKMMRSSFFVKDNPMAEVSCSCKTSFSPKQQALKPTNQH